MLITQQSALILREMMRRPSDKHTTPGIVAATGLPRPTVYQNLVKFAEQQWCLSERAPREGSVPGARQYWFTAAGRAAAKAELKTWTFTESE